MTRIYKRRRGDALPTLRTRYVRVRGNRPTAALAPPPPVSQLTHRVLQRLQKPLQPCLDRAPALAACDGVPHEEVLRIRGPASH